ncbi:MAG: hypothetical protein GY820_39510 [Gammaproteobacteria bacterium]|nr:hypothetical protein [Gammaproteobacteria bacterium]
MTPYTLGISFPPVTDGHFWEERAMESTVYRSSPGGSFAATWCAGYGEVSESSRINGRDER